MTGMVVLTVFPFNSCLIHKETMWILEEDNGLQQTPSSSMCSCGNRHAIFSESTLALSRQQSVYHWSGQRILFHIIKTTEQKQFMFPWKGQYIAVTVLL